MGERYPPSPEGDPVTSSQHRLSSRGVDIPPLTEEAVDVLFERFRREEAEQELQRREAQLRAAASTGGHERLSDDVLRILREQVRVRLAHGAEDVLRYQGIEQEVTTWRRGIAAEQIADAERDAHGLTTLQRHWLDQFNKEGGQATELQDRQIRYIMEHGVIAMIELFLQGKRGQQVAIPIGSVSALVPSPCTPLEEGSKKSYRKKLHPMFPNLDLRDILVSPPFLPDVVRNANRGFTDYRSSIRGPLSTKQILSESLGKELLAPLGGQLPSEFEGWDPRRKGLAFLGKLATTLAAGEGKEFYTFNIATIKTRDESVVGVNNPSLQHNSYANEWGWRKYYNVLVPDLILACWRAYQSTMERVQSYGTGVLEAKGYDMQQVLEQIAHMKRQLQALVDSRKHASLSAES